MTANIEQIIDPKSWNDWCKQRSYLNSRIKADQKDLRSLFLSIHGATEAALRQTIFIGLRLNRVTYKESNDWVFHNDKTPGRGKSKGDYIPLFDRLYKQRQVSWQSMLESSSAFNTHWDLWHGFSKVIRNHLAHSVRGYSEEWIECGVYIDKGFLFHLDAGLTEVFGHSPFIALSKFSPRLPVVRNGSDPYEVTGFKKKRMRMGASLKETKVVLKGFGYPVSVT